MFGLDPDFWRRLDSRVKGLLNPYLTRFPAEVVTTSQGGKKALVRRPVEPTTPNRPQFPSLRFVKPGQQVWCLTDATGHLLILGAEGSEGWHTIGATGEPAFMNGWMNYAATAYNSAQFKVDNEGRVHLRGLIKSGTMGAAAFSLPVSPFSYAPAKREILRAISNDGTNYVHTRVDVTTTGDVIPVAGGNSFLSLDGLYFWLV